jgi:hypothetical protein
MKTTVISITVAIITAALASFARAATVEHQLKGTFAQFETQEINFPIMSVDGVGGGNATLLGRYTEHTVFTEVNLITTVGIGTALYTAANGDTISTEIAASAGPGGPGVWVVTEHHTIIGGTGRLDGATGEFTVIRQFDGPPGPFSYGYLFGTIVLEHGESKN